MSEELAFLTDLTPIGAVLVLAALAQVAIVQIAKDRSWSKARAQRVSAIVAAVLGLAAAVVLGMITGIPDSVVQIVSTILLSIAAVAVPLLPDHADVAAFVVPLPPDHAVVAAVAVLLSRP